MQKLRKRKLKKVRRKGINVIKIELKNKTESKKKAQAIKITIRRKSRKQQKSYRLVAGFALRIFILLLIVCLNWTGLSAIIGTLAYFNDPETSVENVYSTGILDFYLSSQVDFSPLTPGESTIQTITIINNGNIPRYTVEAVDFTGGLCNYLNLEANLDGEGSEYNGNLIGFNYGPILFAEPEDWVFTLTLIPGAPDNLLGETCQFRFIFHGSQIRNNLPFGAGFSDIEEENNNIEAKICFDAESRSKGYWKNHSEIYETYLPQTLGNGVVDTPFEANGIFENIDSMRNKLKGKLLAVKFNIAHFRIGDYLVETENKTLNQIAVEADDLLKQVPEPSQETLEAMKDLLEDLNNDLGQFRHCTIKEVKVLVPNGGEFWWVGRTYDLEWTTQNLDCPNDLSQVSIWYSGDSGATFGNITPNTENDGIYSWRIPLFLGSYFVPSSNARIKVVAQCSENLMVPSWDMSDEDFCPPIDYGLLRPEEIQMLINLGLIEDPNAEVSPEIPPEEIPEEIITSTSSEELIEEDQEATTTEATSTEETTEEATTTDEEIIPDSEEGTTTEEVVDETIEDDPVENAVTTEEEVTTDESPPPEEENPSGEESSSETTEEEAAEETPVEDTPAVKEEPAVIPDYTSSGQDENPEESSGDTGNSGEDVSE